MRITVSHDPAWALDQLDVTIAEREVAAGAASELYVLVPEAWDGQQILIGIVGLRGAERVASGMAHVVVTARREVSATIALAALPCGAWCTEGETACLDDGIVSCELDDAGCAAWGDPVVCDPQTPYCSLGACRDDCVDECAPDETRCSGPTSLRSCGQYDSDLCLDWSPPASCMATEICANGACSEQCTDECAAGAVACLGDAVVTCGDLNADGCLEWGPPQPCAPGTSCSAGACTPECTDECVDSSCAGSVFSACGQFDSDPCLDRSPGTSCVPADPCRTGACTADGCVTAPLVCEQPPAAVCETEDTLRVFQPVGTCQQGMCEYESELVDCPGCPSCDPCDEMVCDQPPGPVCVDDSTLRTYEGTGTCSAGTCTYAASEETCALGCSSGACRRCGTVLATDPSPTAMRQYAVATCPAGTIAFGGGVESPGASFRESYPIAVDAWACEVRDPDPISGTMRCHARCCESPATCQVATAANSEDSPFGAGATATCPAGSTRVAGGVSKAGAPVIDSVPVSGDSWRCRSFSPLVANPGTLQCHATCCSQLDATCTTIVTTSATSGPGLHQAVATCPAGTRVMGGGIQAGTVLPLGEAAALSGFPLDDESWMCTAYGYGPITCVAICC